MPAAVRLVLGTALLLLVAQPCSAQVFVSGGMFANILRFGHYETHSPTVYTEDLSGTSSGLVASAGGVLGGHAVVAVEFARPRTIHTDIEPYRSIAPTPPPTYVTRRAVDYRTTHISILGGYRTGEPRRVRATVLGGIMFVQEEMRASMRYEPPLPPPSLPSETTATRQVMAPVFGLDVGITVAPHFEIVPQVRVLHTRGPSDQGVTGVWPGVVGRWTF